MSKCQIQGTNAKQWCFTISNFTDSMINHISGLHLSNKFLYTTFAILEDDTGNRYLQGYLKTSRWLRFGSLRKLIGSFAQFTCAQFYNGNNALLEIQLNPFQEFGVDQQTQNFRSGVSHLKKEVKSDVSLCQLMQDFPDNCAINPFLIKKHTDKIAEDCKNAPPPPPTDRDFVILYEKNKPSRIKQDTSSFPLLGTKYLSLTNTPCNAPPPPECNAPPPSPPPTDREIVISTPKNRTNNL
jgi:hypothetical protein